MSKIVLFEDPEVLRELEHSFVSRSDCSLVKARTGPELLDAVRRERPGVVLLDASLPGASGLAVCRAIKDDPALRTTPVVFVSLPVEHDRCVAAGADGFVSRPASRARLLEAVRRFVPAVERASERVPLVLRVDYRGEHGQEGFGFTRDLGPEGLFLKTRERFELAEVLELRFSLPVPGGCSIHAAGRVVRSTDAGADPHAAAGAGIVFHRLSAGDHLAISRFVRGRIEEAP